MIKKKTVTNVNPIKMRSSMVGRSSRGWAKVRPRYLAGRAFVHPSAASNRVQRRAGGQRGEAAWRELWWMELDRRNVC